MKPSLLSGWIAVLTAAGCASPTQRAETDNRFCGRPGEQFIELARKHISERTSAENAAALIYRPGEFDSECYVLVMRSGAPPGAHFYINFDKNLRIVNEDSGE